MEPYSSRENQSALSGSESVPALRSKLSSSENVPKRASSILQETNKITWYFHASKETITAKVGNISTYIYIVPDYFTLSNHQTKAIVATMRTSLRMLILKRAHSHKIEATSNFLNSFCLLIYIVGQNKSVKLIYNYNFYK